MKNKNGFTRAEIAISLVLFLIITAVIWKAIDPLASMAKDRDNMRRSHVVTLLNGVLKYQSDHDGSLPDGVDFEASTSQVIGTSQQGCDLTCGAVQTDRSCVDIYSSLQGDYVEKMYVDPQFGTEENTDYYVNRTEAGRVVIGACDPEVSAAISVVR